MLSKDSADKAEQSSSLSGSEAVGTETPAPDPHGIIEGAAGGSGTPPDPGGSDKPPGYGDLEYLA